MITEEEIYFILLKRIPTTTDEQRHEIAKEIFDKMNEPKKKIK